MHTTIETPTMLLTTTDSSNNNLNTIQQQQQIGSSLSSSSLSSMMSMNHNQYHHPAAAITDRKSNNSSNNNKGTSSLLSLLEDTKARIRQLSDISFTESGSESTSTIDFSSSSSDDELEDELEDDILQVQVASEEEDVCGPSPTSCRRRSSILKSRTKSEPRYINYSNKRRSWMALPSPDSNHIKELITQSFSSSSSNDDEDSSIATSSKRRSRSSSSSSVSFTSVTIRSYEQTIGDNPAVSYGTPISLDWNYEEHDSIQLDSYESKRSLHRKNLRQMAISHYKRKNLILHEFGCTKEEMDRARKDAEKIKFYRSVTNSLLPMMNVESVVENATKKVKRLFVVSNK
jgi:hypothetical protein